jgi:hypothetical protein
MTDAVSVAAALDVFEAHLAVLLRGAKQSRDGRPILRAAGGGAYRDRSTRGCREAVVPEAAKRQRAAGEYPGRHV